MADSRDTDTPSSDPPPPDVLTVSDLIQRIATTVEDASELTGVRCIGEVADCGSSDAAVYFTLTDGDAQLQCMIWAILYRSLDIELEKGVEVVLKGDVEFWVEGGRLDLKPWAITVVANGDQAAVELLRAELDERGWFDDAQKQPPGMFSNRYDWG